MAYAIVYAAAAVAASALPLPDQIVSLLQVASDEDIQEEDALGIVPLDAPEWCKNKTEVTWLQRKMKLDAAETLRWAKKQIKVLQAQGETVPEWMESVVSSDVKRGALKWAVQEASHLQAAGKDVPEWMMTIAQEDAKQARRWAACKVAEMRAAGEKVPGWMQDNAKKAIVEAAQQKLELLQAQIDSLQWQKVFAAEVIAAHGDEQFARKRLAAKSKSVSVVRGVKEQSHQLEAALSVLAEAEDSVKSDRAKAPKVKQAMEDAAVSASRLALALEREAAAMNASAVQ